MRNKRQILRVAVGILLAALFLLITSCGEDNPFAPQDERGENEVWIWDDHFEPSVLTVGKGTTVTFTNKSDVTRSVDAGTPGSPTAPPPQTVNIRSGQSDDVIFSSVGTFQYYDSVALFTGRIVVQ